MSEPRMKPRKQTKASLALEAAAVAYAAAHKAHRLMDAEVCAKHTPGLATRPAESNAFVREYEERVTPLRIARDDASIALARAGLAFGRGRAPAPRVGLRGASTRLRLYPSGILFTPFDPRPEQIQIEDVAHGLACTNRFGGHLAEPYNVAQHSLLVSDLCPEQPLEALLHEVAEPLSGLGDVCGPTKRHPSIRGPVKALERGIESAAAIRFGLPEDFASAPAVKRANLLAYAWEDRDLRGATDDDAWVIPLRDALPALRLVPMGWREAKERFLERFALLSSQAKGGARG